MTFDLYHMIHISSIVVLSSLINEHGHAMGITMISFIPSRKIYTVK